MCLLLVVKERFKSFRKLERLEIALHTLNDAIYLFYFFIFIYIFIL
jgi:hypothetical protein